MECIDNIRVRHHRHINQTFENVSSGQFGNFASDREVGQ